MTKNTTIIAATINNPWSGWGNRADNTEQYLQSFPNNIRVNKSHYNSGVQTYYSQNFETSIHYEFLNQKSRIGKDESISLNKPSDILLLKVNNLEEQRTIIEDYKTRLADIYENTIRRTNNSSRIEANKYFLNIFQQATSAEFTFATPVTFSYIWQNDQNKTICFSDIGKLGIEKQTAIDISCLNMFDDFFTQGSQYYSQTKNNNIQNFFAAFHNSNRSIFFLEPNQLKAICEIQLESKIKMWDLKNPYRGSTPTTYELQEKNLAAFSKGYKIILAKAKMPLLPDQGYSYEDGYFYFYITNIPYESYSKYSKARFFFKKFIKNNKDFDGSFLFDKKAYETKMKMRFGSNTIYSNLLQKVFQDNTEDLSELRLSANIQETTFDPKVFGVYSSIKKAKNNDSYIQYTKVKNQLKQFDTKIEDLTYKSSNINRTKTRIEQNIERCERELAQARSELLETNKTVKEIDENLPNYIKAQTSLKEKLVEFKKQYADYLDTFTKTAVLEEDSYARSFKKQGIVIDKVFYTKNSTEVLELSSDHNVILDTLKEENKVKINRIIFRILKPVIIKVDHAEKGDSCKKVLGGPYLVEVDSSNNLNISLLSSASLFGYDNDSKQVWIHPHTPSINTGRIASSEAFFNQILNSPRRACLGEAGPAIHNAFENNDIRQIIIASMTWITNANSADQWGRNAKYFTSQEELKNESFEITKDFVESQNIELQMQDKNEVLNLFSDSLQEVENELEEEEIQDTQEQLQEEDLPQINFSLRLPGVENYTPYNSRQQG